jgi:hypothetical protein
VKKELDRIYRIVAGFTGFFFSFPRSCVGMQSATLPRRVAAGRKNWTGFTGLFQDLQDFSSRSHAPAWEYSLRRSRIAWLSKRIIRQDLQYYFSTEVS